MKNWSKLVCQISSRQIAGIESRNQSGLEFVERILSKYRMRPNLRRLPQFIFRRLLQPLDPVWHMENRSDFNNHLQIRLHFQVNYNYKTNQFSAAKEAVNHRAGTFVSNRKLPNGIGSIESGSSKLTTVIRKLILAPRFMKNHYFSQPPGRGAGLQREFFSPDDPPLRGRSHSAIISPTQKPVPDFQSSTLEIHPRELPVREILSWKPYFNSSQSWDGSRAESPIQAGSKNRGLRLAAPAMQMQKKAASKPNPVHTGVLSGFFDTIPAKPISKKAPAFSGKRTPYIYRAVSEKTSETHGEILPGFKAGSGGLVPVRPEHTGIFSGTIRRPQNVLSKNEFIWRKSVDAHLKAETHHNQIKPIPSAGAVQTTERFSMATTLPENYPVRGEPKAVPEINTIVAAVLKSLDKRNAIERDKRGRR